MSRHSFSGGYNDSAMLSDDGDLYSDDDDAGTVFGGDLRNSLGEKIIPTAADRRAHHNALERKRRDHIKDSFTSLRDSVPSLQGEKVTVSASRAQILKKAAEYIQFMRKKNNNVQSDIDEIAKQNKMLEEQIRRMEKAKNGGVGGAGSALASMHLAGSSSSSSSAAATNGVGHSPLLYTEQIEVATSYDTSEQDSNGSNSNGGGGLIIQQHGKPAKIGASGNGSSGISIINAGAGMISLDNGGSPSSSHSSSSPSSSSSSSSPSSLAYSAGPSSASVSASSSLKNGGGTVLLNGSAAAAAALNGGTLRPVVHLKNGGIGGSGLNGTSKIIVQNPQHKNGGQPHVIHVTTSPAGMLNGVGGGGASKPIIITSAQLSAATAGAQFVINGGPNGKCK